MSDILFETGKADLKNELKENLAAIGAILQSLLTESKVTVEGHTDNVGSEEFNQRLSEQRANAVMQYLIERGIDGARLEAVGHGFSRPIADNATDEGKAKNRRVELIIRDN
ncbi:MAG: OmpA family protein [Fibromonadaceae bacterium]|nr:OmpA family protein [Fibromonadaceae bacterium]